MALPARARPLQTQTRCFILFRSFAPVQVAMSESAHRAKDLAGQLEAVMAANAALKSRTQLLETFMGLQEPAHDAEQTGAYEARPQRRAGRCFAGPRR